MKTSAARQLGPLEHRRSLYTPVPLLERSHRMAGLATLALAYVFSQFYRSFLAVLTPSLAADLGATKADLSLAAGVWFATFALMQFVVGPSLDRCGPRLTSGVIFGVAAGLGAFVFATARTPGTIVFAMALIGIGCSPVLMGALFIFARRFDATRLAILVSWYVAFGNLGNVVGTAPMARAAEAFGWRAVMTGLGIATVALAGAMLLFVRDPPRERVANSGLRGYLELLRLPALWFVLPMLLMSYAPVANLRGLWAGPYLADLHATDALGIGRVTLWMAIAMITGSLIYGPLDRWFGTRKHVVLVGNGLVLVCLLLLAVAPDRPLAVATTLFIAIGLFGTTYGVAMAHGRAFLPPHLLGRGVTLLNFCSIAGAGLMQIISGRVLAAQAVPGSVESWRALFVTYALALGVSLALYLYSRDAAPGQSASPSLPVEQSAPVSDR